MKQEPKIPNAFEFEGNRYYYRVSLIVATVNGVLNVWSNPIVRHFANPDLRKARKEADQFIETARGQISASHRGLLEMTPGEKLEDLPAGDFLAVQIFIIEEYEGGRRELAVLDNHALYVKEIHGDGAKLEAGLHWWLDRQDRKNGE